MPGPYVDYLRTELNVEVKGSALTRGVLIWGVSFEKPQSRSVGGLSLAASVGVLEKSSA